MDDSIPFIGVRIENALGHRLADLFSLLVDLKTTRTQLAMLRIAHRQKARREMLDALFTAAHVHYVRCFAEGTRERLDPDIIFAGRLQEFREVHDFVKDVRDKHISHPVNSLERVAIGVVMDRERKWSNVLSSQMSLAVPMGRDIRNFGTIAKICIHWCRARQREVGRRLQDEVINMPMAELEKLPRFEMQVGEDEYQRPAKGTRRLYTGKPS